MKITQKWFKEKSACSEGIEWFLAQQKTEGIEVLHALVADNYWDWANWLICRLLDKPNQVRYAIFAAKEVITIFEKKHPADLRPRKAIKAAQKWLENPTDITKAAAHAASAGKKKLQLKILRYGIGLLKKGNKKGKEK